MYLQLTFHQRMYMLKRVPFSDRLNVPCSTEGSAECFVIFGEFGVPLFNGGTGEGKKEALFLAFF